MNDKYIKNIKNELNIHHIKEEEVKYKVSRFLKYLSNITIIRNTPRSFFLIIFFWNVTQKTNENQIN